ncbi:hypothetical protein ACGFRG_27100 [Streptomyces sp. NPDC048696]|uniref:hypothetical protein n=1 Tax=Streptomyces sp. NPDC048696 TaxID=3365585 RepID=UPI0037216BE9
MSVDPVFDGGDPQALNGYAYADNSPLTNTDPTGLSACDFNPEICHRETTPETKSEDAYAAYTQQTGIVYNYDTSPPPPKKPKHHHWWQKVWDKVETVAVVVVITVVVVAVVSACLTPAGVACAGVVMAAGEGFAAGAELGASAAVAGAVISAGGEALAAVGAGAAVVAGAARVAKGVSKAVSKSGAEGEAGVAASRAEGAAASRAPEPGGVQQLPGCDDGPAGERRCRPDRPGEGRRHGRGDGSADEHDQAGEGDSCRRHADGQGLHGYDGPYVRR